MTDQVILEAAKRIIASWHHDYEGDTVRVARALLATNENLKIASDSIETYEAWYAREKARTEKVEAEVSLLKEERALRESIAASQGQRILDVEAELAACERSLLGVKAQRDDALGDLAALRQAVQDFEKTIQDSEWDVDTVLKDDVLETLRAKVGPHMGATL